MRKMFYRFCLKSMIRNRDMIGLTGKQKSQLENLLKKCEK